MNGIPAFGVIVANAGRLPAVVTKVAFGTKVMNTQDVRAGPSPPIPHRIDVSADATWFITAAEAVGIGQVTELSKDNQPIDQVYFTVGLGNGQTKKTAPVSLRKAMAQLVQSQK